MARESEDGSDDLSPDILVTAAISPKRGPTFCRGAIHCKMALEWRHRAVCSECAFELRQSLASEHVGGKFLLFRQCRPTPLLEQPPDPLFFGTTSHH